MRDLEPAIIKENLSWLPLHAHVKVRATGQTGVVTAVLPDKFGAPMQVHVKLDEEVGNAYATPLVLGPHEIERIDLLN